MYQKKFTQINYQKILKDDMKDNDNNFAQNACNFYFFHFS